MAETTTDPCGCVYLTSPTFHVREFGDARRRAAAESELDRTLGRGWQDDDLRIVAFVVDGDEITLERFVNDPESDHPGGYVLHRQIGDEIDHVRTLVETRPIQ